MNIWLSYVSFPVTTAVYFEKVLRRKHNVITIGPKLPDDFINRWDLHNLKLPIKDLDIPTTFQPDMKEILSKISSKYLPDLFLWIESVPGHFPINLQELNCPKAGLFIDTHLSLDKHLSMAEQFDYVFIVHRQFLGEFHKRGMKNVFWLPVGCDPEIHSKKSDKKLFDIGFVGSLGPTEERRSKLLTQIGQKFKLAYKRCFWEEMSEHFSQSKIVFNNAIKNDLNMRLFEVMSTGSFLLTDMAVGSGQEEMFKDNEDLVIYKDDDIMDKIDYYLKHDNLREKIALQGRKIIHNAHTYEHRVEELLKVCIYGQSDTPDPTEWRRRSIEGMTLHVNSNELQSSTARQINNQISSRSFVIPVLDMSPASPYNIVKLLEDLKEITGEVIIVFNSLEMAERLKNHPRVDYYAVMSENVGVSRAWNIGLNISQTPVTFILNSDLHIEKDSVDLMEKYLLELEDAAVVGPQGSYFHFQSGKDLQYFDKGSFNYPLLVDAVSGFFFAVKTEYFNSGTLKFDNQYTPCYFEEWDLGLQIKLAGLKSYIVPVTGYEHEWSGSIRALRKIRYMKKEETAGEILERNRKLYWNKWNLKKELIVNPDQIFTSYWVNFFTEKADKLVQFKMYDDARKFYSQVLQFYPDNTRSLFMMGTIELNTINPERALQYFRRLNDIDPDYLLLNAGGPIPSGLNINDSEENKKFNEYYENPRPEIQQMVNKSSQKILDVGCGSGRMACEIKTSLKAELWGIEIIKSAGNIARDRLDKVLIGKVEDNIRLLPEAYFDTIIFADVLEHLIDPQTVLISIKSKLSTSGEIIASIPNVRYWNVIRNLLSGFWEYEDSGIMDNTHLRFFTRSSIINMFTKAGFKIKDLYSIRTQNPDLSQELLNILSLQGINVQTLNDESKDFQYLIRAVKSTD